VCFLKKDSRYYTAPSSYGKISKLDLLITESSGAKRKGKTFSLDAMVSKAWPFGILNGRTPAKQE